jgi:hypothetical protein
MNFTVPKVQVVIGLLALMVAAVLATNISRTSSSVGPWEVRESAAMLTWPSESTPPSALEKLSTIVRL